MNNCEKCDKELKENEEVYEMGDIYVCESCREDLDSRAELLCEDKMRCGL